MTLVEFAIAGTVAVIAMFALGYLLGTVYPLWQPAKEPDDDINGRN